MEKIINGLKFTFRHLSTQSNDEWAPQDQFPFRMYRDTTTSVFTETFLGDNKRRFLFVDYTFHYMNTMIQTSVNGTLMRNNAKILYGGEQIYLLFKGGNVVSHIYNDIITPYQRAFATIKLRDVKEKYRASNYNLNVSVDSYQDFFNRSDKNFSISDVDYSVSIITDNYDRFLQLHEAVKNSLIIAISDISKFFNELYEKRNDEKWIRDYVDRTAGYPKTTDGIKDENEYEELLTRIKNTIEHSEFNDHLSANGLEDHEILKTLGTKYDAELHRHIIMMLDEIEKWILGRIKRFAATKEFVPKLYNLVTLNYCVESIKYILSIKENLTEKLLGSFDLDAFHIRLKKYTDDLIKKKSANICSLPFYSNENIERFKENLAKKFDISNQELTHETFDFRYVIDHIQNDTYKFVAVNGAGPKKDDFIIIPRGNEMLKANNDPFDQILLRNGDAADAAGVAKNVHYFTYNSVISKAINNFGLRQNFDLMRIKFCVALAGGFVQKNGRPNVTKIASEFVDVSVPMFTDSKLTSYKTHHKHSLEVPKLIMRLHGSEDTSDDTMVVNSYSEEDLYYDLLAVLFTQDKFFPWLDKKYKKRIDRLIFFGLLLASKENPHSLYPISLDIFEDLFILADTMLTYIGGGVTPGFNKIVSKFIIFNPYMEQKENDTRMNIVIDELVYRIYGSEHIANIINISPQYLSIGDLLKCIILCGMIYRNEKNVIFEVINKFRKEFCYTEREEKDIETVINDFKAQFRNFLELLVNTGFTLLYMFRQPIKKGEVTQTGGSEYYYKKYIKYKNKYINYRATTVNDTKSRYHTGLTKKWDS